MMQCLRSESGSAILISLVVLMMLGLIGLASVQQSDTDWSIADNYQSDVKSFYTAEAGVERAYAVLRDSSTWRAGFTAESFAGGSFDVTLIDSTTNPALDDTVVVRSFGTRQDALSRVEVKFAPLEGFGWAAFGDDYLKVCGTSMTDSFDSDSGSYAATRLDEEGDVGSNGFVDLCGTAQIGGNAETSSPGEMDIGGSAVVGGDTTTTAPVVILDPVPQSEIDFALTNSNAPAGLSGDFNYNNGVRSVRILPGRTMTFDVSGVYYFSNMDIQGNITLTPGVVAQVYVVGDIDVQSGALINSGGKPGNLQIYSVGASFKIAGGAEIWAAVYAPDTEIRLTGGADLYGSFVGNVADDIGGSSFHYDRSLRDIKMSNLFTKVSWREF